MTQIGSFQQVSYLPSPPLPLPLSLNLPHTLNLASCHRSSFTAQDMLVQPLQIAQMFKQIAISTGRSSLKVFNRFEAKGTTTKIHHL